MLLRVCDGFKAHPSCEHAGGNICTWNVAQEFSQSINQLLMFSSWILQAMAKDSANAHC